MERPREGDAEEVADEERHDHLLPRECLGAISACPVEYMEKAGNEEKQESKREGLAVEDGLGQESEVDAVLEVKLAAQIERRANVSEWSRPEEGQAPEELHRAADRDGPHSTRPAAIPKQHGQQARREKENVHLHPDCRGEEDAAERPPTAGEGEHTSVQQQHCPDVIEQP